MVSIDALTGAILEARPVGSAGTEAYSLEHFYASGKDGNGNASGTMDPRYRQDAKLPIDVIPSNPPPIPFAPLFAKTSGPAILVQGRVGVPLIVNAIQGDFFAVDVGSTPTFASGSAVNAQYNLKRAAEFFATRFTHTTWATPLVLARVHADDDGDSHFDSATGTITIGDGVRPAPNQPYTIYPPASSLDFMTHEYAHGVIEGLTRGPTRNAFGLGTSGEPGAINEALADIFAASAEFAKNGTLGNAFKFAQDVTPNGGGIRNMLHPLRGDVANVGALHRGAPTSKGGLASFLAPDDNGNVHYNSTILSHAWALMSWGGFNQHSEFGVEQGIGIPLATQLFWETLPAVSSASLTMSSFADLMIRYQAGASFRQARNDLRSPAVRRAAICAWLAVGVISETSAQRYGEQCLKAKDVIKTCDKKAAGVYCNPSLATPWDAFRCNGKDSSVLGIQCKSGTFCHRVDGGAYSPAVVDAKGEPVCFPSAQSDSP